MKKIKTEKPVFVVDATTCETGEGLKVAFILAKADKVVITSEELDFLVTRAIEVAIDQANILKGVFEAADHAVDKLVNIFKKKEPWYKRLWKKLKYAFTW